MGTAARTYVIAGLVACGGGGKAPRDAPIDVLTVDTAPRMTVTQHITTDLDLLFVVDNSASITDKQTVFASNLASFVSGLDAFPQGRPNLHIGFISTTVDIGVQGFGPGCPSPNTNDDGRLIATPRVAVGCTGPTDRYISDVLGTNGARIINYTGTLDQTMSCIAQLGGTGCGFEAPMEAIKRALDGTHATENAGFRRPSADLGVIVLTDEDDCSAADTSIFSLPAMTVGPGDFRCQPLYAYTCDQAISATAGGSYTNCHVRTGSYLRDPASVYQLLTSVASAPNLFVAVIDGDAQPNISTGMITTPFSQSLALLPTCTATVNGNPNIGRPGIRLGELVSLAGGHGRTYTACQSDYGAALTDVASLLQTSLSPCLSGAIDATDTDAYNPGVQPACTVTQGATTIPACKMRDATNPDPTSPMPCAWFATDAACTATPTQLEVHLVGATTPVDVTCALP